MKLFSYQSGNAIRTGLFIDGAHYDVQTSASILKIEYASRMDDLLSHWEHSCYTLKKLEDAIKKNKSRFFPIIFKQYLSPVPKPTSCRDGYAFRQHVETARRNRGVGMIPEFDQFPIFYFTNHNAIFGEGVIEVEDDHLQKLDFELECAIVIGKEGKNIPATEADKHIAGYMIMNDLSARILQMEEMMLNLGPAKGKDFATALGPWLVTLDEIKDRKIETPFGAKYDLEMKAFHNGKQISSGNLKDMDWTFAEIIERASYGVTLLPGDVIGSGTVGSGCYLELNGTWSLQAKEKNEPFTPIWLNDGDTIELEIERLGRLKNQIKKNPISYSILKKKKNI